MHENDFFTGLFLLLGTGVGVLALFRHFNLSPILGYLVAGLLVGPNGFGLLPDSEETQFLAELGVVFLMFTIGLEFTLPELLANRRQVIGIGGTEVLLGTLLAGAAAWWLGLSLPAAVLVGGAVAMSSTAVVIKQLAEQMELATRHGRVSVAVLLFQDLATLPFLIMLGTYTASEHDTNLALTFLKAVVVFTGLYLGGRWLARPFLHWVARGRSTEVFMLAALFIVVTAALVVHLAGLSPPLGAFLAGMVLGETEFRHQVEADIRPFQEVLLGLFFATVGMLLVPASLLEQGHWILVLALVILFGKGVLITLLGRLFGEDILTALRSGIALSQSGEFGLLLVAGMLAVGLLPPGGGQILLGAMIVSMAAAPILIRYNQTLADWFLQWSRQAPQGTAPEQAIAQESAEMTGHIIIVGFGRIGQNIATLLHEDQFDYLALDLDAQRVRHARDAGFQVVYGDASRHTVLEASRVNEALALVITHDRLEAALRTVALARQINPQLTILVRTRDDSHMDELLEAGATEVLPEGLEASLMLGAQLLLLLGRPESEVNERMATIRAERYHLLRSFIHARGEGASERGYRQRLHTVPLPAHAWAVGRCLKELELPAEVVAIRRHGIRVPAPHADTRLREGDIVILQGDAHDIEQAQTILLHGH